jgi:hydroxymethylbilane synthase
MALTSGKASAQTRLRIGTRGSRLALWQAEAAREALAAAHGLPPDAIRIVPIVTSGDRIRDRALDEVGGKGLFSKEIEEALLSGAIDIGVHSAKDMQTFLPEGLMIGACLARQDVRDAVISLNRVPLRDLPRGATIGTASMRREALIRRARPDVKTELLRGNVPTRVKRVEDGTFDATLLAAAGLARLDMLKHITEFLPLEEFPSACGQGAIAVECRAGDSSTRDLLSAIDHRDTSLAIACERAFLAALDGSCRSPIAGHAAVNGAAIRFSGIILSHDGSEFYEARIEGAASEAVALGRTAGENIRGEAPPLFLKRLGIG